MLYRLGALPTLACHVPELAGRASFSYDFAPSDPKANRRCSPDFMTISRRSVRRTNLMRQ
jgi:hypothetical protein